jgi:lipoprotein-anchoring transpeptidase ErfK/SrfK
MRYHRTARLVAGFAWLAACVACGEAPDPVAEPIPSPTQLATSQPPSLSPSPSSSPDQTPAVTAVAPPAQGSAPTLVADREILVSISQQHMWGYEHGRVVVDTVVVTGRPELPTPTGIYHVFAKYSPYKFVSPWPRASPYYYDPLLSNYAMEYESGGYFIHDAPWRTDWAAGANERDGSHGCVNTPTLPMSDLYRWARLGDVVVVEA